MDDYQLGYSSKSGRGLTYGVQHNYFTRSIVTARANQDDQDTEERVSKKVKIDHNEKPNEDGTEPMEEKTVKGNQGSSSGDTIAATHSESIDPGLQDTKTSIADQVEQQQSTTKPETKPSGSDSSIEQRDGEKGSTSGLCGTDCAGSTKGGDGLSSADGEHEVQSSTGRVWSNKQGSDAHADDHTDGGGETQRKDGSDQLNVSDAKAKDDGNDASG